MADIVVENMKHTAAADPFAFLADGSQPSSPSLSSRTMLPWTLHSTLTEQIPALVRVIPLLPHL